MTQQTLLLWRQAGLLDLEDRKQAAASLRDPRCHCTRWDSKAQSGSGNALCISRSPKCLCHSAPVLWT